MGANDGQAPITCRAAVGLATARLAAWTAPPAASSTLSRSPALSQYQNEDPTWAGAANHSALTSGGEMPHNVHQAAIKFGEVDGPRRCGEAGVVGHDEFPWGSKWGGTRMNRPLRTYCRA
jgi:hypothetical protein